MKKCFALIVAAVLLVSAPVALAASGSASVSITNTTSIQQGKAYTYTINVAISNTMDFIGTIKFSGVFSHGDIYLDYHPSSNSSTTLSNSVTLTIPANAAVGATGKISVSGQGDYLNDNSDPIEYSVSQSLTAQVTAPAPVGSTPKPATNPTKKPSASTSVKPSATPTTSPTPTPAPTPTPTPSYGEWDVAFQSLNTSEAGGAVTVNVAQNTKIPAALLLAVKEKKCKLTVSLGNCTCSIDGESLGNIPAVDLVDLALTMTKDSALSAASCGADIYQMHFANSGQLPGKFTYSFKADKNKPGDVLYLYYYYGESGLLEGVESATVDANGYATFDIYHCSSYIVTGSVISNAAGGLTDVVSGQLALQAEQGKVADSAAQLKAAQASAAASEARLNEAQANMAKLKAETDGKISIAPMTLILSAAGIVLLTAFLTVLFSRAGLLKKKPVEEPPDTIDE